MKTKILGLAFLAILAINAIALTATASAEVLLAQLLPAPIKPITFTDAGGVTELVPLKSKLELATNPTCLKVKSKGEFTTAKLGTGEITFEECTLGPKGTTKCEDLNNVGKGIINVKAATIHIQSGLLEEVKEGKLTSVLVPALVILPEALHFLCGVNLFLILQSEKDPSCVAGEFLKPNELVKELKVDFKEELNTEGDQDIRKVFNDEDKEYGCQLFFEINESKVLQDGAIVAHEEIKFKEFKEGVAELKSVLIDF